MIVAVGPCELVIISEGVDDFAKLSKLNNIIRADGVTLDGVNRRLVFDFNEEVDYKKESITKIAPDEEKVEVTFRI